MWQFDWLVKEFSLLVIRSGEEDAEVWENAVESLGLPADQSGLTGPPLTLEEACEFVNSWRRQHSKEDLAMSDSEDVIPEEAMVDVNDNRRRPKHHRCRHGSSSGYTRLERANEEKDADGDEDEEEEGDFDDDDDDDDDDVEDDSSTEVEGGK